MYYDAIKLTVIFSDIVKIVHIPWGQNTCCLGNQRWAAVKGCHIKMKYMMSEDHNLR